jgi:hypothetical protein
MPRNPKVKCTRPGCKGWALHGGTLCRAHAGRALAVRRPPAETAAQPEPGPEELRIPTLEEEIAHLAARRDRVERLIEERIEQCKIPELLRYLSVLTQTGRGLAAMLAQRAAAGGMGEIEGFFAQVAERVQELAGEGYHVVGQGEDPLALLMQMEDGDAHQETRKDVDRPRGDVLV